MNARAVALALALLALAPAAGALVDPPCVADGAPAPCDRPEAWATVAADGFHDNVRPILLDDAVVVVADEFDRSNHDLRSLHARAFDRATGLERWQSDLHGPARMHLTAAAAGEGVVVVGANEGPHPWWAPVDEYVACGLGPAPDPVDARVVAADADDGAPRWTFVHDTTAPEGVAAIAVAGGLVHVAVWTYVKGPSYDPGCHWVRYTTALLAFDPHTGAEVRRVLLGDALSLSVAPASLVASPDGARLYLGAHTRGAPEGPAEALVLALDAATGDVLWEARRAYEETGRFPTWIEEDDGRVHAVVRETGMNQRDAELVALDAATGTTLAARDVRSPEYNTIKDAAVGGGVVALAYTDDDNDPFVHYDAVVRAHDAATLEPRWTVHLGDEWMAATGIDADTDGRRFVLVGDVAAPVPGFNTRLDVDAAAVAFDALGRVAWRATFEALPEAVHSHDSRVVTAADGAAAYVAGRSAGLHALAYEDARAVVVDTP